MLNRDNYKGIMADISNPDKSAAALLRLNDEVEELFAAYDNSKADSDKKDERIRELQDTNQALFLRVTGVSEDKDDEDEESTPEQVLNDLVKTIGGE